MDILVWYLLFFFLIIALFDIYLVKLYFWMKEKDYTDDRGLTDRLWRQFMRHSKIELFSWYYKNTKALKLIKWFCSMYCYANSNTLHTRRNHPKKRRTKKDPTSLTRNVHTYPRLTSKKRIIPALTIVSNHFYEKPSTFHFKHQGT